MSFKLPQDSGHVDIALRIDTALDMTDKEYDDYILNPLPENLKLHEGKTPTFLRLRRALPWGVMKKIEDSKIEMVQDRDGDKVSQNMKPKLSWMYEEVRCALVDIINPPDCEEPVEYKRDSEFGASYDLAAALLELGVMMDLWNGRRNAIKNDTKTADKKK